MRLFPVAAGEHQPAFVYSTGMAQVDFPELLCFAAPGMEQGTIVLLQNLCMTLLESVERFGRNETLRAFCTRSITAREPEVTYTPRLLQGDSYLYALNAFVTRAVRFRAELGFTSGDRPRSRRCALSLETIRAQLMLAASV